MEKKIEISEEVKKILLELREKTRENKLSFIGIDDFAYLVIDKYLLSNEESFKFISTSRQNLYSFYQECIKGLKEVGMSEEDVLSNLRRDLGKAYKVSIKERRANSGFVYKALDEGILLDHPFSQALAACKEEITKRPSYNIGRDEVELDSLLQLALKYGQTEIFKRTNYIISNKVEMVDSVVGVYYRYNLTPERLKEIITSSENDEEQRRLKFAQALKDLDNEASEKISDPAKLFMDMLSNLGVLSKGPMLDSIADKDAKSSREEFEKYNDTSPISGTPVDEKSNTPVLDQFSVDMTKKAKNKEYDPVIGRDLLVDSMIEVLAKRKKANVVLIGEAGTGKSSVVELLAQRIVSNNVPKKLVGKRICSLNLNDLVAGTKYRGEYEERLQKIIKEVCNNPDVIVYIDELHNLVGNGSGNAGGGDGANILKPYLARGEFQCIGSTTLDEYRRFIEKDSALNRRFTQLEVTIPTVAETKKILSGITSYYEKFHHVKLTKDVIDSCVTWADRYISDKNFPDKAIDVLDLAAAIVSLRENGGLSDEDRQLLDKVVALREEKIHTTIEEMDFDKASQIRERERVIQEVIDQRRADSDKESSLKKNWSEVTVDDVALAVSKISRVPMENINQTDTQKISSMKKILESRVVGQSEAIDTLVQALLLNNLGLHDEHKPLCSMLAVGPSGVGKTMVARELADIFFGSVENLIKIDGGEFKEEHSIAKLIGAPAGYVGYDSECIFDKVRQRKHSVILIDEVDKMHKSMYDIWLSILETSTCKLSNGTLVDFSNCVIIFTGNIGTKELKDNINLGFVSPDAQDQAKKTKSTVMKSVQKHFRPEFINRLDKVVVFNSLGQSELSKILSKEISKVKTRLKKKKITFEVDKDLKDHIIGGCNPLYGARDLGRGLTNMIVVPISNEILNDPNANKFLLTLGEDKKTTKVTVVNN